MKQKINWSGEGNNSLTKSQFTYCNGCQYSKTDCWIGMIFLFILNFIYLYLNNLKVFESFLECNCKLKFLKPEVLVFRVQTYGCKSYVSFLVIVNPYIK